jgi:hypothetical protein
MEDVNKSGLTEMGFEIHAAEEGWATDRMVMVEVHAAVAVVPPELTQLRMSRRTKRRSSLWAADFRDLGPAPKSGRIMSFLVAAEMPDGYADVWGPSFARGRVVAMTFADFCWMCSSGTTPESALEISFPAPSFAVPGDLTWALPAKFVDDLVETLYALNQDVLEGRMMDSWLVGPMRCDDPRICNPMKATG